MVSDEGATYVVTRLVDRASDLFDDGLRDGTSFGVLNELVNVVVPALG